MRVRTTRRLFRGAIVLVGVVLLGACYLGGTPQSGDITVTLPSSDQLAEAGLQPQVTGDEIDTARIYLSRARGSGSTLIDLNTDNENTDDEDVAYLEIDTDGEETDVTLSDVPTGAGYRIYVGVSNDDGDSLVGYAWTEETFDVSAGENPAQTLTLKDSDFAAPTDLETAAVNGLTAKDGVVYASTSSDVFTVSATDETSELPLGDAGAINSVTGGGEGTDVFVNAEEGIYKVDGTDLTPFDGYDAEVYGGALTSIGFTDDDTGKTILAFQTEKGLGFSADATSTSEDDWFFFPTADLLGDTDINLKIFDLVVDTEGDSDRAFLATSVGGFIVTPSAVDALGDQTDDVVQAIEVFDFYDEAIGSRLAASIAFDTSNDVLYVAARGAGGAWAIELDEDAQGKTTFHGTSLSEEELSIPNRVENVAVQGGASNPLVALLTKDAVILYKDGDGVVEVYPFVAYDVEPGQSHLVAFRDKDGDDRDDQLVVAGSNGVRVLGSLPDAE